MSGSMTSFVKPSGRSKVRARPEAPHGNFAILIGVFLFRLGFRQAAPGDFGVGEDYRRDDDIFEGACFANDDFDGDAPSLVAL